MNSFTKLNFIPLFGLFLLLLSCNSEKKTYNESAENSFASVSNLKKGFQKIPDSIQTSVYWYWISDNISKEGVVKDLEAMKKVGINRAFIGNIGLDGVAYGKVKLLSDEWWDILHTALKTATRLNIEIGIFNSPGWSQSGGPWIKPSQAMRYLTMSSKQVKGPKKISLKLPKPAKEFQDVKVIAFPKPKDYDSSIEKLHAKLASSPDVNNITNLMDGNLETEIKIPSKTDLSVDISAPKEFTARSLQLYPAHHKMKFKVEVQVKKDGSFKTVASDVVDRSNDHLNTGFKPYAPAVITIPETTASHFRIIFHKASKNSGLKELDLSASPKVEEYAEKTLAKMYPTPLPYWKEYQWKPQPSFKEKNLAIDPKKVIDISKNLTVDGTLNWNVPKGDWVIMRSGMTPTQVTNSPAAPEGTGLEVDKMSKKHVAEHFNAFLGKILKRIPPEDRKTWKVTVEDSYETGGQNWTDELIKEFKDQFGYSPVPYIPVIQGRVVGSEDKSDRFLWDLRRFVAHEVAYKYVAGLREVSHKHGLHTWLENYGHWGFPSEFLMYGGQSDEIGGEFWSEGELGNIENKAASSAAHIYGKQKVSAESFTAGGKTFARYPEMFKQRGDRFFTEGINNTLLHLFIEQPYENKSPGVNAPFGNEFNRKNTWFYDMDMFIDYIKRCNFMLQQGRYVADVAYFIGEDAPKMTGVQNPALPKGYSFDYINAEVIEKRLKVKDGRFVLPDGLSYKVLVLPQLKTMRPSVLKKIKQLVKQGGVVLGPAPERSPSLTNYPKADQKIKKLADELWKKDGSNIHKFGKGKVLENMDLEKVFQLTNTIPDIEVKKSDSTLFIHRKINEGELYFVSNQSHDSISIDPKFRVTGMTPTLFNAINGEIRELPQFTQNKNTTSVPLTLSPLQSAFIVFNENNARKANHEKLNFPTPSLTQKVEGPWQVDFDRNRDGEQTSVTLKKLTDWTKRPEKWIKYYSGTAVYHNSFNYKQKLAKKQKVYLELGKMIALAKVEVNGVKVGGTWTYPYRVDITKALKEGKNTLQIRVTNNWMNRIIGDMKLPKDERTTWLTFNPYHADSPLQESGLIGPITLQTVDY